MPRTNLKEVLRIFIAHTNIVDQDANINVLKHINTVKEG